MQTACRYAPYSGWPMCRGTFLLVSLLVAAVAALTGCGKRRTGGASESSPAKKVFGYIALDEPKRLDPAFVYDVFEGGVSGLIYDQLVLFDEGTGIQPGLAEKWELSPDARTYTFHLRDAKFCDGRPLTSADVRYSFTRILLPATGSDRKWLFDKIEGADDVVAGRTTELSGLKTPDARTVVITLIKPYPPFLVKLAMPNGAIIPEGSVSGGMKPDREFERKPIGTGAWVLENWLHDRRLEFRRNEYYWGPMPKVERLICHIQVDERVSQQQFDLGNVDMNLISFAIYPQWVKDPVKKARMMPIQELNTYFIAFMNNKPKFADKRVRQAISHAINTRNIFENLQKGRGEHSHGPVPPGVAGYRPEIKPREYDPEKAKKLLAEAGVSDLSVSMWLTDEALTGEMMAAARADLERVGIKATLTRRDLPSLREAIYNGEPDMYFFSWWVDYPDIENALVPTFHSRNIPRAGNGSHYSSSEFDRVVADADGTSEPQARLRKYQQAEDMIIDDCPWVFLYHRKTFTVVQPWVTGFRPAIMYNADRFLDVDVDMSRRPR